MLLRNTAGQPILIGPLLAIADGSEQTTGATVNVRKDGVDVGTPVGVLVYVTAGIWQYTPSQAETDCGILGIILSKTGSSAIAVNILTTRLPVQTAGVIPAVAAGAAGGLPTGDASGRVLLQPTQTGVTIPTVTTAGSVSGNVVGSVGSVTSAVTLTTAYDAAKTAAAAGAAMTLTAAERTSLTGVVWTNATRSLTDKTGYSLATAPPTAVQIRTELDTNSTRLSNLDVLVSSTAIGTTAPAGWINTAAFATGATVPKVALVETLTTYTGNTPQTGDMFAVVNPLVASGAFTVAALANAPSGGGSSITQQQVQDAAAAALVAYDASTGTDVSAVGTTTTSIYNKINPLAIDAEGKVTTANPATSGTDPDALATSLSTKLATDHGAGLWTSPATVLIDESQLSTFLTEGDLLTAADLLSEAEVDGKLNTVGLKTGAIANATFASGSSVPLPATPPAGYGGEVDATTVQNAVNSAISGGVSLTSAERTAVRNGLATTADVSGVSTTVGTINTKIPFAMSLTSDGKVTTSNPATSGTDPDALATSLASRLATDHGAGPWTAPATVVLDASQPNFDTLTEAEIDTKLGAVGLKANAITAATFASGTAVPLPATAPAGYGGASLVDIGNTVANTPVSIKASGIATSSFAAGAIVPLPNTAPAGYGGASLTDIGNTISTTPVSIKSGGIPTGAFASGAVVPLPATPPAGYGSEVDETTVQNAVNNAISGGVTLTATERTAVRNGLATTADVSGVSTTVGNINTKIPFALALTADGKVTTSNPATSGTDPEALATSLATRLNTDHGSGPWTAPATVVLAAVQPNFDTLTEAEIDTKLNAVGLKSGAITNAVFAATTAVPLPTTPPAGYGGSGGAGLTTAQSEALVVARDAGELILESQIRATVDVNSTALRVYVTIPGQTIPTGTFNGRADGSYVMSLRKAVNATSPNQGMLRRIQGHTALGGGKHELIFHGSMPWLEAPGAGDVVAIYGLVR